jgi:hypothetical protein
MTCSRLVSYFLLFDEIILNGDVFGFAYADSVVLYSEFPTFIFLLINLATSGLSNILQ